MEDWNTLCIIAGRGFGKTYRGASLITNLLMKQRVKKIGLLAPTIRDVRFIMWESNLKKLLQENLITYRYIKSENSILLESATIQLIGANRYDILRGFEFDCLWIDELCKFVDITSLMQQVYCCLRLPPSKLIITSTPNEHKIFQELQENPKVKWITGTSLLNHNLSDVFRENIELLRSETTFYESEILGKVKHVGLWTLEDITYADISNIKMQFYRLGIDLAVGNGTTAIILCGFAKKQWYIMDDYSTRNPNWIEIVMAIINQFQKVQIVIEINQGGILVEELFRLYDIWHHAHFIRSTDSKGTRHNNLYQIYKILDVKLAKKIDQLEYAMLNPRSRAPGIRDRLDALAFCFSHLTQMFKN